MVSKPESSPRSPGDRLGGRQASGTRGSRHGIPLALAGLSVVVVASLGIWGWSVDPGHASRWAFIIFFLPAFWGFVELAQGGAKRERIMKWHRYVVAGAGLMLAVRLGPQLAIATDLLDASWAPIARRTWGVGFGCLLAIWGNHLPKILSPWSAEEEWFDWQRVHRFAGWLASLSGIALVVVWLALPIAGAKLATVGITVTLTVLCAGRKFLSVAAYSRRRPPTTPLQASSDAAAPD